MTTEDRRGLYDPAAVTHDPAYVPPQVPDATLTEFRPQHKVVPLVVTPNSSDARVTDAETVGDEGGKVGQRVVPDKA
jgi:hypothetical protein